MKKFLVLALVLSVASLATAGLSLNGPAIMAPSDIATIELVADPGEGGLLYVVVLEGDPGTLLTGAAGPAAGDLGEALGYVEGGWNSSGYELTVADSGGILPGGIVGLFDFHCDGPGDVVIRVYNDAVGYEIGDEVAALTITQIPEPATMALLGLGALVLRRKK